MSSLWLGTPLALSEGCADYVCIFVDMTVEGSLIVCVFDRAVVGFSLGPMSSSALVLGQICSTRLMFPFVEQF